jgi:hypothetical protein
MVRSPTVTLPGPGGGLDAATPRFTVSPTTV